MDRRDFILHASAAVAGVALARPGNDAEPDADPHKIEWTKAATDSDPWHFHWEQPTTRMTEKEAMGQAALGTPLLDPVAAMIDCGRRPVVVYQRPDGPSGAASYRLMGNAYVEVLLRGERVARSPYARHVNFDALIGPNTWQLFVLFGARERNRERDTPELRAVADWICLNVDTHRGWERIIEYHQTDWFARIVLDERCRHAGARPSEEEHHAWNAKFRDALTHGPDRK